MARNHSDPTVWQGLVDEALRKEDIMIGLVWNIYRQRIFQSLIEKTTEVRTISKMKSISVSIWSYVHPTTKSVFLGLVNFTPN